jgi:MOSC domain-containing protein YiiM
VTGTVVQINLSRGGLPKFPVGEALITPLGIEGDACAHPQIHGGPLKAVLIVCAEAVEELVAKGYPLFFGALGENLTARGLDRRQMRLGQRYQVGQAILELTKVRRPCAALDVYGPALKHEINETDPASERWGLSGFYASVLRPGRIAPGDRICLIDQAV